MSTERPTLSPHIIGQYFNLDNCQMYLTWKYDDDAQEVIEDRDWITGRKSPLLMGQGIDFERRQLEGLPSDGHQFVVPADTDWDGFDEKVTHEHHLPEEVIHEKFAEAATASPAADNIVLHQPRFEGTIGAYDIRGDADIIGFLPTDRPDTVDVVVFEIKNSDEQKVSHRVQAAIYADLVRQTVQDYDLEIGTLKTYVLTQSNNLVSDGLSGIEEFEYASYLAKLELLLESGNEFDDVLLETPYEDTYNRINSRCAGCDFEAHCVGGAAQDKGLELLGLDEATQRTLENIDIDGGVQDIEDFATLFDQPGSDSRHDDYTALDPTNPELVEAVRERTDITDLQERTQIAYHFLTELDWNYGGTPDYFPHQLQGSGYNLPWDDHNVDDPDYGERTDPDYPQRSLVRVYLYIQHDHALGRLSLLSAVVENERTNTQIPVTKVIDDITPDDRHAREAEERKLLSRFFSCLGDAITDVAPDLTDEGFNEGDGFPHLYIYSHHQREQLMSALRRHEDIYGSSAVRKLLGLRPGVDQEMVSVLHQEFRERQAFRFAGLGIVQTVAHYRDDDWFNWAAEREDGTTIEFSEVFNRGFFDGHVSHDNPNGGFNLNFSRERRLDADEYNLGEWVYPVTNRETDQIPAEYLWAAHDMLSAEDADNPDLIRDYLYRNTEHSDPITFEDIELFAQQICHALRHIDAATWSKDRSTPKEPLDLREFDDIEFEPRTLADAVREYQQLEFWTNKESKEADYRRPLSERVAAGEALLVKNTDGTVIPPSGAGDYPDAFIEGPLMRNLDEEYDPEIHSSVAARPLSRSEGDWCVTVPVTDDSPPEQLHGDTHNPTNLQHGATTIIEELDAEEGHVRALVMGNWPQGDSIDEQYCVWHYDWTTEDEPGEYEIPVSDDPVSDEEEAGLYVIEPAIDEITQSRASAALEPARIIENVAYTRLSQVYTEEREDLSIRGFSDRFVNRYLTALAYLHERPNEDQRDLIQDTDHSTVLLQGPPGTGKTKYTLAPTVLSRAHAAAAANERIVGCISAVSHDAVNEAMRSVASLADECPPTDDLELLRICSSEGQSVDHERVENIYYHDLDDSELADYYDELIDPNPTNTSRKILAATPATLYRFIDKMADAGSDSSAGELMENRGARLFDLAIVDEASMMDLPAMFLITAFVNEESQTFLVGDHRQMEPIQQHSWEEEDRITIERNRPFLSALNFLRFLRGDIEESDWLRTSPPDLDTPDETIPMHQLTETYRLPDVVAEMHTDLHYEQDGITLESKADHDPFPDMRSDAPDFLSDVLDPDEPISLLEHNDDTSEKENPIEAALISSLLKPFDIVPNDPDTADEITAGVVVPYNRQKRLLSNELDDEVEVDTVEKFQGRERNLIVVSAASADPNYVHKIAEFLLNPNRFNVATSRMMQKVIIVAGTSVFQASSSNTESFDEQTPWIEFYGKMGGFMDGVPSAEVRGVVGTGTFDRLINASYKTPDRDVTVRRLTGYDSDFDLENLRD